MTRRTWLALTAVLLLAACQSTKDKLAGDWQTVDTPLRTIALRADGTYDIRFTGRTLGIVNDLAGPIEKGRWRVEDSVLVLVQFDDQGKEKTRRLPIGDLKPETVQLGNDRYRRVLPQTTP